MANVKYHDDPTNNGLPSVLGEEDANGRAPVVSQLADEVPEALAVDDEVKVDAGESCNATVVGDDDSSDASDASLVHSPATISVLRLGTSDARVEGAN